MRNHRKKCGTVQSKIENESDRAEEPAAGTIVWSEADQFTTYVEESVPVEKVDQTAIEIINSDIQRHRKSTSSKKRRRSSTDSNSIDVSLSSFLISSSISFDVVDSPFFKKFMNKVNPNYIVPSSSQIKSLVLSQLESRSSKKRKDFDTSDSDSE
jgi:hypothetical protein